MRNTPMMDSSTKYVFNPFDPGFTHWSPFPSVVSLSKKRTHLLRFHPHGCAECGMAWPLPVGCGGLHSGQDPEEFRVVWDVFKCPGTRGRLTEDTVSSFCNGMSPYMFLFREADHGPWSGQETKCCLHLADKVEQRRLCQTFRKVDCPLKCWLCPSICACVCVCVCVCASMNERKRTRERERERESSSFSSLSSGVSMNSGQNSTKGCRTKGLQAENVQSRGIAQCHGLLTRKHDIKLRIRQSDIGCPLAPCWFGKVPSFICMRYP